VPTVAAPPSTLTRTMSFSIAVVEVHLDVDAVPGVARQAGRDDVEHEVVRNRGHVVVEAHREPHPAVAGG